MKKLIFGWITLGACLTSLSALAEDSSSGCGLGWQVTNRMSLASSSIRSTTNAILPNTFSMTSGTSGCAKHEIVKNDEKAVMFAVNNYDSLVVEMAEGHGEYLHGFAQTLGCNDANFPQFQKVTQENYRTITEKAADNGIGFYQAVRTELLKNEKLKESCVPQV